MMAPERPSKQQLADLQEEISRVLPLKSQQIALVYGGATKIKEYVFEATKLPEIRGASALLEWVNDAQSYALWADVLQITPEAATQYIVYASGGNVLGFAPVAHGHTLAQEIEHCYTMHTQTAKSVAVAAPFHLLELRYGRLRLTNEGTIAYWVEDFLEDWQDGDKQAALRQYYYYPPDAASPDDESDEALRSRFFNRKKFGELVTVLAAMSNRRRDERQSHGDERQVPAYALQPWAEKCDSSDIRPAVYAGTVGDDQRKLSEPSARKRSVGQQLKYEASERTAWFGKHFDWPKRPDITSWEAKWNGYLNNEGKKTPYARQMPTSQVAPPKDLSEIGAASRGYIGMIYADGNNVGRVIARLATPGDYYQQSQALDEASKSAVFHALSHQLSPCRQEADRWIHPFEILSIGGDDILLIVPGNAAFDIALDIAYQFEYRLRKPEPAAPKHLADRYCGDNERAQGFTTYTPQIGLSAGVVIAHENAPIFFLRDLVEQLLKRAKKLARIHAKQQQFGGAVDFMVLKSITMVTDSIKAFRKEAFGDDEDSVRRLTARPYTWHEFAGLFAMIQALQQAQVPRSQLYRLRRVMEQEGSTSTIVSTMEYLYTRLRMRKRTAEALQQQIEAAWQGTPTLKDMRRRPVYPWLPYGEAGWETIWPDMIEMYDMVKMAPESEEAVREEHNGSKD
jgi:CRISPR-associated protein Cmr2